jgi:LysR family glycine cleavage system transcriptional activator
LNTFQVLGNLMSVRPPLNALHVFCTVVREGGLRQAAQSLSVTPGAVSRQIQVLEAQLGYPVLERTAGIHCAPTRAGGLLYERIADKMAAIIAAVDDGAARRHATVLVDTSVTLAMHWLIPRLRGFSDRFPRIQVQVRTVDGPIDPATPAHVFIRRERSELRGLPCEMFMTEHSVLVAGPGLLPSGASGKGSDIEWLRTLPRIGANSRPDLWPRWNEFHGIPHADSLAPTLCFDNTVLAIQAAAQGLGICVVPEIFVEALLDSRSLQLIGADRIETGSYSFALGRQSDSLRVTTFIEWMREIASFTRPRHGRA